MAHTEKGFEVTEIPVWMKITVKENPDKCLSFYKSIKGQLRVCIQNRGHENLHISVGFQWSDKEEEAFSLKEWEELTRDPWLDGRLKDFKGNLATVLQNELGKPIHTQEYRDAYGKL